MVLWRVAAQCKHNTHLLQQHSPMHKIYQRFDAIDCDAAPRVALAAGLSSQVALAAQLPGCLAGRALQPVPRFGPVSGMNPLCTTNTS